MVQSVSGHCAENPTDNNVLVCKQHKLMKLFPCILQ